MGDLTVLIDRARQGDRAAVDRVFELLHPELRRIAHRRLTRSARVGGVDTTALVHECYIKLVQRERISVADRAHFLGYAATMMRSIVVDMARAAAADRRGGSEQHVELDTAVIESTPAPADEILDVNAALDDLHSVDPRLVKVVEMRYFLGMADGEIAQALDVTDRTVRRDWAKARLLLAHALRA